MDICSYPLVYQDTNEAVQSATHTTMPRGRYVKLMAEQQAAIIEYASPHSNQVAIRHFTVRLGVELKFRLGR